MRKFISALFLSFDKRWLSVLIFTAPFLLQAQDTLTVERLDYKFVTNEDGVLSPIGSFSSSEVAGFFVPCESQGTIEFCGEKAFSIWVDGRHYAESQGTSCVYPDINDLCSIAERDTIYVTVVSRGDLFGITARSIVLSQNSGSLLYPESRGTMDNLQLLGFVFFSLVIILSNRFFPSQFSALLKPGLEQFSSKPWSVGYLVNLALSLLLFSFIWYLSEFVSGSYVLIFMSLSMVWAGKSVLLIVSSQVFSFDKEGKWQMNLQLIFFLGAALLLFVLAIIESIFFSHLPLLTRLFPSILTGIIILYIVYQIFVFRFFFGRSSLHRFLYLCTTEILPAILIINWFLK